MNHLLIAISAGLGVCVVLLLVLLATLVRRTGRLADERVSDVVRVLETRMDELGHELAGAVDRAAVSLADAVGERRAQNQPGTDQEYPNWKVPLADASGQVVLIEDLFSNPRLRSLAAALNRG